MIPLETILRGKEGKNVGSNNITATTYIENILHILFHFKHLKDHLHKFLDIWFYSKCEFWGNTNNKMYDIPLKIHFAISNLVLNSKCLSYNVLFQIHFIFRNCKIP